MNELQAEYEETYGEGNYIPPVRTTFWSFRIMVGCGMLMILLALYGSLSRHAQAMGQDARLVYARMIVAIFLPFIANTAGWIMTEIGRQPWTVFGLLTVEDSVSPNVTANEVLLLADRLHTDLSDLLFVLIYLFVRTARKGPNLPTHTEEEAEIDPYQAVGGGHVVTQ